MEREVLEPLVQDGLTVAAIARRLGVDRSTVRRWLRRYGLGTQRMAVLARGAAGRAAGVDEVAGECPRHGAVRLTRDARGTYRCPRCAVAAVSRRRRKVKDMLVAEAGGRCAICMYDRCFAALAFHHVDPATKEFGAFRGLARSIERARAEAAKCILLCANCHAEVEAGLAEVADAPPPRDALARVTSRRSGVADW